MKDRPKTLREVAVRAEKLSHFGLEFADWLHTVRALHSRPELAESVREEPPFLRERFPEGAIADAWLAAYAEYLADKIAIPAPAWASSPRRNSPEPWYASTSVKARARADRDSPPSFRSRNLFTDSVDLPLRLRAGRPPKSPAEKRRSNADRQRRFRARLGVELELLRTALSRVGN